MIELIKIANSQLTRTPENQVVKVAGILRQLKNWIKSQISSDFRKQVDELEKDSAKYSLYLEPIAQQISKVQSAIKDKELEEYKRELLILKKLINEAFLVTNKNLNTLDRIEDFVRDRVEQNLSERSGEEPSGRSESQGAPRLPGRSTEQDLGKNLPKLLTKELANDPEIIKNIITALKEIKGYDLPINQTISKSFRDSSYYRFLVNEPERIKYTDAAWDALVEKLKASLPKGKEISFNREKLEPIVKKAIANGIVSKVQLQLPKEGKSRDGKPLKNPATGVVLLEVESEFFNIPGTSLKSNITVVLRDETTRLMGGGVVVVVTRHFSARTIRTASYSRLNFYQEIIKNAEEESILMVPGIEKTSPEFRKKLISLSRELGTNPDWLAAAISKESMFKTYIPNSIGAVGLIQFLPATQAYLYDIDMRNKTPEEKKAIYQDLKTKISSMSDVQQLDLVKKYFKKTGAIGRLNSPQSVYSAIFFPLAVTKDDDFVIADQNSDKSISRKIYQQNKGIDKENTGLITKRMLGSFIESAIQQAKGKRITVSGKILEKENSYQTSRPVVPMVSSTPVSTKTKEYSSAVRPDSYLITPEKFLSNLENLLKSAKKSAANDLIKEANYKKNNIKKTALITIEGSDRVEKLEYAKNLANMIVEILNGTTSIHAQNDKIQIQASVYTNENLRNALIELSSLLSKEIKNKLNKNVYTIVANELVSNFSTITNEEITSNHRKFIMRYS